MSARRAGLRVSVRGERRPVRAGSRTVGCEGGWVVGL